MQSAGEALSKFTEVRMVSYRNIEEMENNYVANSSMLQKKLANQDNYKIDGWARSKQLGGFSEIGFLFGS